MSSTSWSSRSRWAAGSVSSRRAPPLRLSQPSMSRRRTAAWSSRRTSAPARRSGAASADDPSQAGGSRSARHGHARVRARGVGAAFADEKPRAHRALPLHLDRPARLAVELVADELVGRVAQLYPPRHAVRLHPARRVHGISPDIEHELPQADYPAHAGPAAHADP